MQQCFALPAFAVQQQHLHSGQPHTDRQFSCLECMKPAIVSPALCALWFAVCAAVVRVAWIARASVTAANTGSVFLLQCVHCRHFNACSVSLWLYVPILLFSLLIMICARGFQVRCVCRCCCRCLPLLSVSCVQVCEDCCPPCSNTFGHASHYAVPRCNFVAAGVARRQECRSSIALEERRLASALRGFPARIDSIT